MLSDSLEVMPNILIDMIDFFFPFVMVLILGNLPAHVLVLRFEFAKLYMVHLLLNSEDVTGVHLCV